MKRLKALLIILFFMICSSPGWALNPEESGAPKQLENWTNWVLYGYEAQYYCPKQQNANVCLWPISMEMNLGKDGGSFKMQVEVFYESMVPLPGENGVWPKNIRLTGGKTAPILKDSDNARMPALFLKAGRHTIEGDFQWNKAPETISLPSGSALTLTVDGKEVPFPVLKQDNLPGYNRLWLKINPDEEVEQVTYEADSIDVRVNRLIEDGLPMNITSNIKIAVSGKPREVVIDNAMLPNTRAWRLSSPLPAQLDSEGLKLKVKPGVYEIVISSRDLGTGEKIGPVSEKHAEEYWAFMAVPSLRQTEVSGAAQIDPSQADTYAPWRSYPIYVMKPGSSLNFNTLRRGDPKPQPDSLNLSRECWLDYNGQGLGCRDNLKGAMNRQWHLNVSQPFELAQASLDGQPQVITWQTGSNGQPAPGLQLRKGLLNMVADLRIEDFKGIIPASGWDQKLDSSKLLLHLAPGHHLFHASGAEATSEDGYNPASWTGAWDTLDFFIVLIISIAIWKLYGRSFGVIALIALIISYHEPWAPRMVFLHLLGTTALLRILPPKGKARALINIWRFCAAMSLVLIAAMFLINQAQVSIFPQLENPYHWSDENFKISALGFQDDSGKNRISYDNEYRQADNIDVKGRLNASADIYNVEEQMLEAPMTKPALKKEKKGDRAKPAAAGQDSAKSLSSVYLSQAPDAKVQNSLARPNWQWRDIRLHYKGAASVDQEAKLYIYGPAMWRILGLMRIVLMIWLSLLILEAGRNIKGRFGLESPRLAKLFPKMKNMGAALVMAAVFMTPGAAMAQNSQEIPSQQMLDQYQQRLLTHKNLPQPSMSSIDVKLQNNALTLSMVMETVEQSALMLPALDRESFQLSALKLENGADLPVLESGSYKLTLLPPGRHTVLMQGRVKNRGFQITFHELLPEFVSYQLPEKWHIYGLEDNNQLLGQSIMVNNTDALDEAAAEDENGSPGGSSLDPVFEIQRRLAFGLEWRVYTTVNRINPDGRPASLSVALLPGEYPLSSGFKAENGRIAVHFGPNDSAVSWESSLPVSAKLDLSSEKDRYETWSLDISPIWSVKYEGIPPIYTQYNGLMQPTWKPWPEEKLSVSIDRPQPVPGQYLVIDNSDLSTTIGENFRSHVLNFTIRSSQGGPYSFKLPKGSELRTLQMNGRDLPTADSASKEDEYTVTLPLSAGEHKVMVYWVTEENISAMIETPQIDMGVPMANMNIVIDMDKSRWILWAGGPLQGPAVQFWPLLFVVLLVAFLLSRTKIAPLGTAAWFLLGIGLIQYSLIATICVVGWLLILANRNNKPSIKHPFYFNAWQVMLACFTLIALILIYQGIKHGLLQNPDMLISGHNSYAQRLSWFYDRSSGLWPTAWVLSSSKWFYKAIMLAWSLWMALSLIKWLRWGWAAFNKDSLWKKSPKAAQDSPQTKNEFLKAVENSQNGGLDG